jgi:CBS domain-containing protein
MSIREVVQMLVDKNRGAALICQHDRLLGIFTERDALRLMAELAGQSAKDSKDSDRWSRPISEVMTQRPLSISRAESVASAITKMSSGGYRRLPVVDEEGRPVAVVKVSAILSYLVEHFPKVVYTLPPAPHHKMQEREGA